MKKPKNGNDMFGILDLKNNFLLSCEQNTTKDWDDDLVTEYTLSNCSHQDIWMIDNEYIAQWVIEHDTAESCSTFSTPNHGILKLNKEDFVVVRIEMTFALEKVTLPTFEELIKDRYEKTEPGHCKIMLHQLETDGSSKLFDGSSFFYYLFPYLQKRRLI